MPVTITPSPETSGVNKDALAKSGLDVLKRITPGIRRELSQNPFFKYEEGVYKIKPIIKSSFADVANARLIPYGNGLVHGVLRAFQQDLHLVLRPDDIWLAILTQFSFYANGKAEHLRLHFVSHAGQKPLELDYGRSTSSLDMGQVAQDFTRKIQANIVDPDLAAWALPTFSTTTAADTSVAALVFMSTVQRYFTFTCHSGCGFPAVTLQGERADYAAIHDRLQRLPRYGRDVSADWCPRLAVVLNRIIATFDAPDAPATKDFWLRAVHAAGRNGSGRDGRTLSGWLTAFCHWEDRGQRVPELSDKEDLCYRLLTSANFNYTNAASAERRRANELEREIHANLT